jgi:hypothetical protein
MPRDGSGTYVAPEAAVITNTPISSASYNASLTDLGNAVTQSLSKDGQTIPTVNLPMGTYRHTNVGNGSARNDYAAIGQVQDAAVIWGGTAGGTANAITVSLSPAITAYTAGMVIRFINGASANTGATTLNVNGVGAVALNKGDGTTALAAGDLPAGHIVTVIYDGTRFRLVGVFSGYGATLGVSATAAAARAALGATATGSAVLTAANAAAARSAIVASADPTTSPGVVGTMQALNSGSGSQLEAPSGGGTWICWWLGYSTTTYTLVSIFEVAEVSSGTLLKAGAANIAYIGIAFRKS